MNIEDVGTEIQRKAEEHLMKCQEQLFGEEEGTDTGVEVETFGPYCGCDTCIVREVLGIAWDSLVEAANSEKTEGERDQEAINQVLTNALKRIADGVENPIQTAELALSESGK
jgi:hypothetical protein